MADYSAYLPATPPASAFVGLSPEEQAQIQQYATPDNVGRIHPMGGFATAGHQRYQEGMGQYLDAVLQGNIWKQHQLQQVMHNNLREAAINQSGRVIPELARQGDLRLAAGSDYAEFGLPGLQDEQGAPSDAAFEADEAARRWKQGEDMKNVASAALSSVQAGFTPEQKPYEERWGLPTTQTDPLALRVARAHAAGMRGMGGTGAPVKVRQVLRWDPVTHQQITDYEYDTRANAVAGSSPQPGPSVSPAATTPSGYDPVQNGYVPVHQEELTDEQAASGLNVAAKSNAAGYQPIGYFKAPDGQTVLMVQPPDGGKPIELPLDDPVSGSPVDEGP